MRTAAVSMTRIPGEASLSLCVMLTYLLSPSMLHADTPENSSSAQRLEEQPRWMTSPFSARHRGITLRCRLPWCVKQ